jgi:methionine-rich copper-binding protein CopC
MTMRKFLFPAIVFALLFAREGAQAHAFLLKSTPPVGAATPAPMALRLEFSEGIEVKFSKIALAGSAGAAMEVKNLRYDGNDKKVLLVDVPALPSGAYRVTWHVVSVDTHATEGDFGFTVKQ